jgi:hypothetical protein
MATVTIERVGVTPGSRAARVLEAVSRGAADELAGRTVWCAAALPRGRAAARRLSERLAEPSGPHVAVRRLDVEVEEPLRRLADRLDRMLARHPASAGGLGGAERDLYDDGARRAEGLAGDRVRAGDVVVLHDTLAPVLAEAIREHGAHVVWELGPDAATANEAWAFLQGYTAGLDAYLTTRAGLLAAHMPSPSAVAAKEVAPGGGYDTVGLSWLLADVVHDDRREHVGGTLHARPAVTAR